MATTTEPRPLTIEEQNQLYQFAKDEGRSWKKTLMFEFWMRGIPVRGYPALYGLRNTHGPSWLDKYRLPKA